MYKLDQLYQDSITANFPTTSAVTTTYGFNAGAGPLASLDLYYDLTFAATPCAAQLTSLLNSYRVVVNSEVVFNWSSAGGAMGNALATADAFSYFLNSFGVAREDPSSQTVRQGVISIPLGMNLTGGVNNIEVTLGWAATAAGGTPSSGRIRFFGTYNDAIAQRIVVAPATSYQHTAGAIEQVILRTGGYEGFRVASVLVQNDSSADEVGDNGIRVVGISGYGLEPEQIRVLNGDVSNGIQFTNSAADDERQLFASAVDGCLNYPTLGLTGGDTTLIVDSSSTTTRFYTPVLVADVKGGAYREPMQTERVGGSPTKKILSRIE